MTPTAFPEGGILKTTSRDEEEEQNVLLIPPLNFSMVASGVYRSGYPNKKNHQFLRKLGLKSIIYLCPEDYSQANMEFIQKHDIKLFHFGIEGNKEPFVDIPHDVISQTLVHVLDARNHPILIHCNKGKVTFETLKLPRIAAP